MPKKNEPKLKKAEYGTRILEPVNPIRIGKGSDRRYDENVPRGEGKYRFRIYRLRAGELQLVAAAPDAQAMGLALATLHGEHEFMGDDSVGVLDTIVDPGHWVVHPYTLGRKPRE